jgi:hypothetical protein
MTTPYDDGALWVKAKLFLNWAMDDSARTFDEQALLAAMALELLGKAALARISPLLIADPSESGLNVMIAAGLVDGDRRFVTVAAKTVYSRCALAFKPFREDEAKKITQARNAFVHGAAPAFTTMPAEAWWPRYWSLAVILVNAMDREIVDLVGTSRDAVVEAHLAQNRLNIEHRTQMLIERARLRLAQFRAGSLPVRTAGDWKPGTSTSAGLRRSCSATCPACASDDGRLEGDEVEGVEVEWDRDFGAIVTLSVATDYFGCSNCGLILDSYELVEEAGLDVTFETDGDESDLPDYEPDYGND